MLCASRHPCIRAALAALAVAVALPPATARAQGADTDPPVISHTPVPTTLKAGRVKVEFRIEDRSPLFGVLFHWRHVGDAVFRQIDFPSVQTSFVAELDVAKDFEFWIEAFDEAGNGPALDGTAEAPHRVKLSTAVASFETIEVTTPVQPPPPPTPDLPPVPDPPPARRDTGRYDDLARADANAAPVGPLRSSHVGRLLSARNLPTKMMELRTTGAFEYGSDFLYPAGTVSAQSLQLQFAWAPAPVLQLGFSTHFRRTSLGTTDLPTAGAMPAPLSSLNDLALYGRVSTPALGAVFLALEAAADLPSPIDSAHRFPESVEKERVKFVASGRFTGLLTVEAPQARIHLNAGYFLNESQNVLPGQWGAFPAFAYGLSRYDAIQVGAAVEFPLEQVVPFLEYSAEIPVNRRRFATCTPDGSDASAKTCGLPEQLFPAESWQVPQRLGLGARYDISPLLAVDLGVDLSLTRAGRSLSDTTQRSLLPLEGLPPPAPFALRLDFTWQFGAAPEQASSAIPTPATNTPDLVFAN